MQTILDIDVTDNDQGLNDVESDEQGTMLLSRTRSSTATYVLRRNTSRTLA